jgi:hypothetical protein
MGKRRSEVVRFAVGGPDEPRSLVWRIWTGKGTSDLYISGRLQGGDWKVSLHESGDWRFALSREYAEARGMEDRLREQWERPQPLYGGITSAFNIIVPSADLALPREPLPEDAKKHLKNVTWVRPAPEGYATHFIAMYTEPGEPVPETEVEILANFWLPDGRTVSVTLFENATSAEERRQIEIWRRAIAEAMRQADSETQAVYEAMREPRAYLHGRDGHGTRFFYDIVGSALLDTG